MVEVATKPEDKKPDKPCSNCHGKKFWNIWGDWVCENCHPCPDKSEAEFYKVEEK